MTTTTTITLLATDTTETLPLGTPAMRAGRFNRLYTATHGPGVPAEVHTAALWAGPDAAEAHEALCAELADEASTLDAMPAEEICYVLLAGQGEGGCDVWAAARTATVEDDARATGWRPTHRITTRQNGVGAPGTVDVCLHDGVAYTAHEWASQSDADWEVSDEGEWLYRGREYPGAYEVTEL